MAGEAIARQRIDKWLFFARVVKSRSLAAKLAASGKVRVNRDKIDQASYPVKVGDVLTITLERRILVYKIVSCAERRGPALEARLLYEDMSPPVERSNSTEGMPPRRESGAGRPTKKERRDMDRLRDT
ncbi:RNA-binding S4 domain-containing protein [Falsochrobactrum sp. TDYN1]|uniref:RNA-binding S4 domain-containing protein n=1 Tax=Falsochrobactrum tianjinense TaxID=2706015 RepID=A0A949PQY5_9HYPH|nr:RNA-binding S4 domain-containing protein [Falsochrobactrum sp. TDYN1]MBV2144775.1 RNA-binding S4 domain-containing protein [Falsochrobactrum sp. TDYN1]